MGSTLPQLSTCEFADRLEAGWKRAGADFADFADLDLDAALRPGWRGLLWQHYEEMRRWNPKLSLVGPGTAAEVVERHYVESLCGLLLLPATTEGRLGLLDVGTGGGFPGFVLAIARSDLDVVLMEPNQRKCAFLSSALRRVERHLEEDPRIPNRPLSCVVLNARVERPLPPASGHPVSDRIDPPVRIDVVTSRALAWTCATHRTLLDRWPATGFLLWVGQDDPELPEGVRLGRRIPLAGSRRIVEIPNRE